jgi:hypothetical protein
MFSEQLCSRSMIGKIIRYACTIRIYEQIFFNANYRLVYLLASLFRLYVIIIHP